MERSAPIGDIEHPDMVNELSEHLQAVVVQDLPVEAVDSGQVPSHRSHDPKSNAKHIDPFQFGQRYLSQEDDVFEFNAWDHVQQDDEYKEWAEAQVAKQREAPVSDFDKGRFNSDPAKWWNKFYVNNTSNFFKNRKWLFQEFDILRKVTQKDAGPVTVLEVGAGNGSTCWPLLAENHNQEFKLHACDFSKKSIEVIRQQETYIANNPDHVQADVWDITSDDLPPGLVEGGVDVIIMIFIFSALEPKQWKQAVTNAFRLLKLGGELLFRDYARGDLAMIRFKKGRYLEENFYVRGDGTRVYFFDRDELERIWTTEHEFTTSNLAIDNRLLVNRGKQLKMYRSWIQGRFIKSACELHPS